LSDFAATCLIWVLAIWLGVNAAAITALAVAAAISHRKPTPKPQPTTPPKRTWATEMGLRQPK
jgi:hypothetical protein